MSNKLIKKLPEIKPCPFCGAKANTTYGIMSKMTMIICSNYQKCGATVSFDCPGANIAGEKASIDRWNRRA